LNLAKNDDLLDVTDTEAYSTTHDPIHVWEDRPESPMTIGIGLLCEDAGAIVLASDTRASFPKTAVDPHDFTGKQYSFYDVPRLEEFMCVIAGNIGLAHDVSGQLGSELKRASRRKHIFLEHVQNAVNDARSHELLRRYNWALKVQCFGLTCSQLLRGRLPRGPLDPVALNDAKAVCNAYDFNVELIVAGYLGNTPVFLRASGKDHLQCEPSPGVYVIGSKGKVAALDQLNKRGQNITYGLARTLLHAYEAMKAAQDADKYVGNPAFYTIIFPTRGMWRFNSRSHLLRGWASAYKDLADTLSLEQPLPKLQVEQQIFKWSGHEGSDYQPVC